ncbi:MAG: TRAP transporter small permease [Synergistetes bacterium]|nr:TRAP transporter small permease [Synergistota bacterium]MCX8128021.1 TRAP transporter small permease [Synergistota bacterium]MDW8192784.1 TRAP transporter small permease [Synergistota bacterium]
MERIFRIIDRVEAKFCQILLGIIVGLVFVSALLRYIGYPINWTNALASGLFVWLIYIGADRALRRKKHIGMGFFVEKLPSRIRWLIGILVDIVILVFLIYVSYLGIRMTLANTGRVFEEIFFLSYSVVVAAVPVGTILMSFTLIYQIYTKIRGL